MQYDRREALGDVVLDWVNEGPCEGPCEGPRKGVVILFHGLAASSSSLGIRRLADEAVRRGFVAVAYNRPGHAEGCAKPVGRYPEYTDDDEAARVVHHCAKTTGLPVYAIGLSAGANALTKYLGQPENPIRAAVAVANGLDLARCHELMDPNMSRALAARAMRIYARHWPRFRARSLAEFDERVSGTGLAEYYAKHSSLDALRRTRVPTMCLAADNDPLIPESVLDAQDAVARENPNVVAVRTKEGGHCGWVTNDRALPRGRWMEAVAFDFVEKVRMEYITGNLGKT
jgi:predicted alpha/beta-fold hydrolase